MKTKTFAKKLSFKKSTIATLNVDEMHQINGGDWPTILGATCDRVCPTTNNQMQDETIDFCQETI